MAELLVAPNANAIHQAMLDFRGMFQTSMDFLNEELSNVNPNVKDLCIYLSQLECVYFDAMHIVNAPEHDGIVSNADKDLLFEMGSLMIFAKHTKFMKEKTWRFKGVWYVRTPYGTVEPLCNLKNIQL